MGVDSVRFNLCELSLLDLIDVSVMRSFAKGFEVSIHLCVYR